MIDERQEIIKAHNAHQAKQDQLEEESLKPRQLKGTDLTVAEDKAKAKLDKFVAGGEKSKGFSDSPLRLYTDPEKRGVFVDAVTKIQAINDHISTDKLTDLVITATSHVGTDDTAKSESLNGHTGRNGARYTVVGHDLAKNVVIVIGKGDSQTTLHVPRDTFKDIQRLRHESFDQIADKLKKEKDKPKTDYKALVPPLSPTGRVIVDTAGEKAGEVQKKLQEGAKITKEKLTQGREWLRQKYKEKGLD
jgi:hypothetical protein